MMSNEHPKRQRSEFSWPFLKQRTSWIRRADSLMAEAAELRVGSEPGEPASSKAEVRRLRKAGRLLEMASDCYGRSSLGVSARLCLDEAAECWMCAGDEESCQSAERRASAIPTYWTDESEQP